MNPMLAIHDVGAGGLSNAFPELVDGAGQGATFDLRRVPLEETGLAPKEIWCNESQERYVLAVNPDLMPLFEQMCERERCPFAVVGVATAGRELVVEDGPGGERVIDMPLEVLLGKPPRVHRDVQRLPRHAPRARPDGRAAGDGGAGRAAPPHGGEQALPGDHRRPHRGRPVAPRPDGRPLAGARWPTAR